MVRDGEYQRTPFEERYEIVRELGSGHFAVVRQCTEKSTGNAYAAKYIRKRRQKFSRRGAAPEDIDNEIAILRSVKHENIISLHEVFEDDVHVILVLELVSGGELFHYLSERDHLSEEDASKFVQQILRGLNHLHEQNIAHLDLKPENILLGSNENQIIKIIDFGLAKRICPGATEIKCMMGTAEFVAPEIVNYEPLSLQTDLWAVGVITFMLLSGTSPFAGQDQQETFVNITSAEYDFDEEHFSTTSDLAKDFIRSLLIRDPKKRLSARQALEHPWIRPRSTQQMVKRKASAINMTRLKAFSAKRRWQKSLRVVKLCNRLSKGNRPASTASLLSAEGSSMESALDVPENFVTRAIFCAIEDENRQGLERLLGMATVDINNSANDLGVTAAHVCAGSGQLRILDFLHSTYRLSLTNADNFGDTPLHWAARQDHKEITQYLLESGTDASVTNCQQETALSQAVRYGHECIFDILMNAMNPDSINKPNSDGDSCIHLAACYGSARCLQTLLKNPNIDKNAMNSRKETALHLSAVKGAVRCVEILLNVGADCNQADSFGFVPLVCALKNHQQEIIDLLVPVTRLTVVDREGSSILHHAVEVGNYNLVEHLISRFPELVKKQTFTGLTALHQAARHGHLEIARLLCSASADAETLDFQGLSPEVTAFLNGHKEAGNFLKLLSDLAFRERMLNEMLVRQGHLEKFSIRVMGHGRVGKTSLIKALQATAIGNLVRRGSALFRRKSTKRTPSKSPSMANLAQMRHGYPLFSYSNISLSPDFDVGIFDLSSDPICLQLYSHLIRYSGCLYVVVFSLADSAQVQREQVSFWLRLLSLSVPCTEPVGYAGKSPHCPLVLLVGTHGDTVKCNKNSAGFLTNPMAFTLVETMKRHFGAELTILPTVFVVDNGTKNMGNIAGLKGFLATVGRQLRSRQHPPSIVLKKILDRLPVWRGTMLLLSFSDWTNLLLVEINPLITRKESSLLIDQLVFMGEVVTVKVDQWDYHVVISPHYLLNQLVMPFLYGQLQLKNPRHLFRSRDLHFIFSNYWQNTVEVVKALEVLGTCSSIGSGELTVFEFPMLVDRATPPRFINSNMTIRIRTPDLPYFPMLIFPRILTNVKRALRIHQQLNMTIMFRAGVFGESIILKWDSHDESIEISAVGERAVNVPLLQYICSALNEAIADILPSALLEFTIFLDGQPVSFTNFDEIKVIDLPLALFCRICRMLDPKHSIGQDWCLLAVKLGLYENLLPRLAVVNSAAPSESTTYLLLKEWKKEPNSSINRLLLELENIDRKDVADLLKKFLPVYKTLYTAAFDSTSPSSPSEKTLSSMSSLALSR